MKQSTKMRRERTEEQVLAGEGVACVICAGLMDGTDQKFKPCRCGFRLCVWCFHKIREEAAEGHDRAKCPGCRREYNEQILNLKVDVKKSNQKPSRKHLEHLLVVQRRIVRLTGLPKKAAKDEVLRSFAYLGQYGAVCNVALTPQPTTCEAHVTFVNASDASRAVAHVDGCALDGHVVRASHTLHRYCPAFIRSAPCGLRSCPYLHSLASEEDHVPKGDQPTLKPATHIAKGGQRKQGFPPVVKPKPQQQTAQKPAAATSGGTNAKPSVSLLPATSTWGGMRNLPGQAAAAEPAPVATPAVVEESAPAVAAAAAAQALPTPVPVKGAKVKQHTSWASAAAVTVMSVSGGKRTQPKTAASARVEGKEAEKAAKERCRVLAEKIEELPGVEAAEREAVAKGRTLAFKQIIQQWIQLMTKRQEIEERALPPPPPPQQQVRHESPRVRDALVDVKEEADNTMEPDHMMGGSRLAMWQAAPVPVPVPGPSSRAPAKSEQTSGNGLNPMAQGWMPGQGFAPQQPVPGWGGFMQAQPAMPLDMLNMGALNPALNLQAMQVQQAALQQGFLLPVGNGLVQLDQGLGMQPQGFAGMNAATKTD